MKVYGWKTCSVGEKMLEQKDFQKDVVNIENSIEIGIDTSLRHQKVIGFGTSFSESGWKAIKLLDGEQKDRVFKDIFSNDGKCKFSFNRMPIGANDYANKAYSYADSPDDYPLKSFSISKEKQSIIPFVKRALEENQELILWSCPFSPPFWMKTNGSMCFGGELIDNPDVLHTYAAYIAMYVDAYEKIGIPVHSICVQNSGDTLGLYPSATMSSALMFKFVRAYLLPMFLEEGLDTEIWMGTFNNMLTWGEALKKDSTINENIKGIVMQNIDNMNTTEAYIDFPEKYFVHGQSIGYAGDNSWEDAKELFSDINIHLNSGCINYTCKNLILDDSGESVWGNKQNSMLTVKKHTKELYFNYEYYIIQHFSRFIMSDAERIDVVGMPHETASAYLNPDGSIVLIIGNFAESKRDIIININRNKIIVSLDSNSIYTLHFKL